MAAIFVLTRHTSDYWHFGFFRSYLAVDLFFILSGFVIAYAYDEKLKNGSISVSKFLLIRLIRLYPVYLLSLLVCTSIIIVKVIHGHIEHEAEVIGMLAMTALFIPSHTAGNNDLFSINGPYWSLMFELVANAIYVSIRPLLGDVFLVSILIISGMMLVAVSIHHGTLDRGVNWGVWSLVGGLSRSIFGIFMGLFLYRHHVSLSATLASAKSISPWLAFVVIAAILASSDFGQLNIFIDVLSVTVIFPICILVASQGGGTRFQRLLLILGTASYPMYVLHIPLGNIFSYITQGRVAVYAPVSGIIFVLILIVLSILIEKWYDIPLRSWLSRHIIRRRH